MLQRDVVGGVHGMVGPAVGPAGDLLASHSSLLARSPTAAWSLGLEPWGSQSARHGQTMGTCSGLATREEKGHGQRRSEVDCERDGLPNAISKR